PESILLVREASMVSRLTESYALSLASKYDSRLMVVDVLEKRAGRVIAEMSQLKLSSVEQLDTVADTELKSCLSLLPDLGTESDLVLEAAKRSAADLIVITVPETHRFRDRVLSTNSYRVVSSAPCPVLTVHARS